MAIMHLGFDTSLIDSYKSASQRIRILTEDWISRNMFCPLCGYHVLNRYEANRPVADFYCSCCHSDYELKSKKSKFGKLGTRINDGAYSKMIERITSLSNPNFLFLTYYSNTVNNVILIPNYFFIPEIIEKRKPLSENAVRTGWIGCNVNIASIPDNGKIFIVKDGREIDRQIVLDNYKKVKSLKTDNLSNRGWIIDVLKCIDRIEEIEFNLNQVYGFIEEFRLKYPLNNNIEAKIRQQLQFLRDKGLVEFVGRGRYRKL